MSEYGSKRPGGVNAIINDERYRSVFYQVVVFGLFIWLPTLHFWTALGKDALVILGIILITYSLENLKKRFLFAIPSLILIVILRNYISIMVVGSIILSIFLNNKAIKQSSKVILLGVIFCL